MVVSEFKNTANSATPMVSCSLFSPDKCSLRFSLVLLRKHRISRHLLCWKIYDRIDPATSLNDHLFAAKFEDFSCVPGDTVTDGVQYIAPNLSFSQDGVIRQWKIGVEDRTDESVYLQLWRLNGGSFIRVGETLYVKSTAGEIVEVPTSMSASAGDVVGFYNPRPGGDGLKLNWVSVTNHVMYGGERSGDREAPLSTIEIMDTFASSPLLSISFGTYSVFWTI